MCTHTRFITNKYTGSRFLVKCGKCKACLQEKAINYTNRIRREFSDDRMALFVTLTYDRFCCPYIDHDALLRHDSVIEVKREVSIYTNPRTGRLVRTFKPVVLDELIIPGGDYKVGHLKWLKKRPHKVGVCFYKDYQDFIKRLRSNISRSFIYHEGFSIFNCSEYGPRTKRPHFHFLLFIRPVDEAFYRAAILQAWPFANKRRTECYIERARDPASYIASYVNCRTNISSFLAKYFAPKKSTSQYFGLGDKQFSLSSILQKIDKGSLDYVVRVNKQGVREDANFLIPFYVINRYFPKFKGYSRLTDSEVSDVLLSAGERLSLYNYKRQHKIDRYCQSIDYTPEDIHKIQVRLRNAIDYYCSHSGRSRYDYFFDYMRVWSVMASNVLKRLHEVSDLSLFERYDNIYEVDNGQVNDPLMFKLMCENANQITLNPNNFISRRASSNRLSRSFDLYDKTKKVSNEIMSRDGHYV